MVDFVIEIFEETLAAGHHVEYLRADNARENMIPLRALCQEPRYRAHYERTMPGTPQQNGVVERSIELLRSCAHAQCLAARFKEDYIQLLWAEAVNKANRQKVDMYKPYYEMFL
jgi:hypothetical protein